MQRALYYWLITIGVGHLVLGLMFVVVMQSSLAQPYLTYVAKALSAPASAEPALAAILQLFGPTVASWGLLFCVAVEHLRVTARARVKWLIVAAVLVWLLLDCAVSGAMGLYWHWAINGLVALLILPPLVLYQPQHPLSKA